MSETGQAFEKYVFFSSRKEREVFGNVMQTIIPMTIDEVTLTYDDKPDESFRHVNDRIRKILMGYQHPEQIKTLFGTFSEGGVFELHGGTLSIAISSEQYNFELVDNMKRFLSAVFPISVFQTPYIWGVDLYEDYSRELFFETRIFQARSKLLEEPEVDIFRRDDGIIYKFRFHTREHFDTDEGIRNLAPLFMNMADSLKRRIYEGLEVLQKYCCDQPEFRKFEPRTKIGRDVKAILANHW